MNLRRREKLIPGSHIILFRMAVIQQKFMRYTQRQENAHS
jgi:hypothetical protein